jgi:hypothetical protein
MKSIFRRVGAAVARLFDTPEPVAVRQPRPRRERVAAPLVEGTNESAFLDKLKDILFGNGGAAQAGRINVIGLDRIKDKLGDRWSALSERVHAVARSALNKCLQPGDIWTSSGDSYVIAFGSMNVEEARTKCRMIAQMIESALLGEADGRSISVATAVATVDGQVLLRDLPALDAMLATGARVGLGVPLGPATPAVSASDHPSAEARSSSMDEERRHGDPPWVTAEEHRYRGEAASPLSEERARSEAQVWPIVTEERKRHLSHSWPEIEERTPAPWRSIISSDEQAAGLLSGGLSTPAGGSQRSHQIEEQVPGIEKWQTTGGPARTPMQLREFVDQPILDAQGPTLLTRSPDWRPPEHLEMAIVEEDKKDEIAWEPMWDVQHERIPIYRARYVRNSRAWLQAPSEELMTRVDFVVRDAVLRELIGCLVQSRYILLGLPVRYWTLASYAQRRDYLAGLAQQVSSASKKFLLIFITDVPDGVPASRLQEILPGLRRFCREVVIETTVHLGDFSALGSARVFAVGADLSARADPERLQMQQIDQFARAAAKAGIVNCCLAGVQSVPLVTAAIAAGFRYISGPVVAAFGPQVSNVQKLGLDYVYRANLEAKGLQWPRSERGAA